MSERIEIERVIAASPEQIFEVLRDPAGHVRIDSTGMLQSASGEPAGAVGDSFVIHMDRESLGDFDLGKYDVTVTFVTFDAPHQLAWKIDGQIKPPIGHIYGYRLEPAEAGTKVVSYYDWSSIHPDWKASGIFPVISELAIKATLGILARTVEPHAIPKP